MSDITITLSQRQFDQLKEKATQFGMSVSDLVLLGVEEILAQPDEKFKEAVKQLLEKNAELYRRLA